MKKMFSKELIDFIAHYGAQYRSSEDALPNRDMHAEAPDVCIVGRDFS